MSLAENLKTLRKYRGMTQKELSEVSGVSCSSIINYENSRRTNPPVSVLTSLASALGVGIDVLGSDLIDIRNETLYVYNIPHLDEFYARMSLADNIDDWETFIQDSGEKDILNEIARHIKVLNKDGAAEAVKRVAELTEIPRYRLKQKWEGRSWPEDAPPTAAAPNPGSDQTDAGK